MFVIIMQKMTSVVLNNCQKKGQQPRSPGHGQGCIAGFGRARQNGAAFHTFWEEDQKGLNYSIHYYCLKPYKNSKNTTQWMISAM